MISDEFFYEQVVRELECDGPRKGLWAKAYAEADGTESLARAIYMRLRAVQLIEEHRARAAAEEQERGSARRSAEDLRRKDLDELDSEGRGVVILGFMFVAAIFLSAVILAFLF